MNLPQLFKKVVDKISMEELESKLEEKEEEVRKWTNKLREAHEQGKSMSKRRRLRIELDEACEARNDVRQMIEYKKTRRVAIEKTNR